ncbi:hypothetical protein C6P46_001928 [Rhodotorula mucilaginosa]|uniref:HSF-type DNA-binding domain-containing protein n=1 Tax=Rhodotorula mucilaginosa TaxID=5537 RepID=A0A9P6W543_RHOMI|nr:hypothetical protein C6P46_001928 [Rhodotorula mucilaginosa]
MHRGGSGRDLAEFSPAAAAATADEQGRQPSIQYPYAYSDPPAHAYADYSDYGQCSGAHYAQQGAVVEADSIPPPGDGGHQIPYGDDPQFPPYASDQQHALPPQPHELHHRGTVFASVESARWASSETDFPHQPGVADPSDPIHGALHTQAQPENNLRAHQRRRSSGLVVGDSAGAADDHPSSAFDDPTATEIKPFVYKIFAMLSDPERYQDVILWDHTGEAFFVAHNDRFVSEVLREQFQHTNIHSFTRQLNVYQFQRFTVSQLRSALDLTGAVASTYSGWTHPNFRRGRADLLHLMTPRPSRARLIRKLEKQYSHTHKASKLSAAPSTSSSSGARSTSSAGGSSSHSSSVTESDSISPPTSARAQYLPPSAIDMVYTQHYASSQYPPPQPLLTRPVYPSRPPQNGHEQGEDRHFSR